MLHLPTTPIPVVDGDVAPAPATTELPVWSGLPPVTRTRYVRRSRWTRLVRFGRAAGRRLRALGHGPAEARALFLLAVVVLGGLIGALIVLEGYWPSDYLGTAR
ncbi:hypothetical protein [Modestobacter sp. VKM Ac-2985]|uniref:hypothetical protein n=1 Tax=Modestobacter sp. VKM Ac-2985 TaxID=3004139 RepID=UPI0022ABB7FB|nr:hypothetical protein [Modestobacter sp. VKM Ac-2985]MCZ2837178.1 hypothetical protein [Modestobacter sp. VKM Ac-2985]